MSFANRIDDIERDNLSGQPRLRTEPELRAGQPDTSLPGYDALKVLRHVHALAPCASNLTCKMANSVLDDPGGAG